MKRALIIASLIISSSLLAAQPVNPPHPVVNINTATEAQLVLLPGVGPKLANEIYTFAEAGPKLYDPKAPADSACDHRCHFKAPGDLDKVKGIGAKKLAALLPYVVVTGETTATVKIKAERPASKGPETIATSKPK